MESVKLDRQRGQILVTVALMAVAIFAFVAIAVDVGQIYGGRRSMQNAADAAALAGAREICFGNHGSWPIAHTAAYSAAVEYAVRNGADPDEVEVDFPEPYPYTVGVVAGQSLNTFFAGVIRIHSVDVRAEAEAMCGGTVRAGGLWPLAFDFDSYHSIDCKDDEGNLKLDEEMEFWVFNSDSEIDCYDSDEADDVCTGHNPDDKDKCACDLIGPHIKTSERGWLRFFTPEQPYAVTCPTTDNCGAAALKCWLEEDHPGPVDVGDCVVGKPGTVEAARQVANDRIGDVVNIVLWDRNCYDGTDPDDPDYLGDCQMPADDIYHVAGFGCIEILGSAEIAVPELCSDDKNCVNNLKVIRARKICDGHTGSQLCSTEVGVGTGLPSDEWEVRTVNLVK